MSFTKKENTKKENIPHLIMATITLHISLKRFKVCNPFYTIVYHNPLSEYGAERVAHLRIMTSQDISRRTLTMLVLIAQQHQVPRDDTEILVGPTIEGSSDGTVP
jgi:hypothetical protein